jgi:aryl-alcohol dehydrogenase-like predicted oxidoreductase
LAQLSLAWLLAQGKDIVPIVGTRHSDYLADNLKALSVQLSQEDLARINEAAPLGAARGQRYPEEAMKAVNR